MPARDPLYSVELVRLLEESTSMLRHDVRNRLGSIRNMAYFVNKRVSKSETAKEPRVADFLGKMESEVQQADDLIETWVATLREVYAPRIEAVEAAEVVNLAVEAARIDPATPIQLACEDALLEVDRLEIALAVRCLIENAAEARTSGAVHVGGAVESSTYEVRVKNQGPALPDDAKVWRRFKSEKPGRLGLGLCLVRRVAQRFGGKLWFADSADGVDARLVLPLAGSGIHALEVPAGKSNAP
jgi:signal transduction histidine kinase